MIIRRASSADQPDIRAIMREIWAGHDVMDQPSRYQENALVAVVDGSMAGVGSAQRGRRDPSAVVLHVDVAHRHRRCGVGSALLTALIDRYPARLFVARALRSRRGAREFLEAHGFEEAERALEGTIEARSALAWAHGVARRPGLVVRQPTWDEMGLVVEILAETYRRTHPWNPPAPFTAEEAHAMFVEPALADSAFVAEAGGEILGAAVITDSQPAVATGGARLQWAGSIPPSQAVVDSLIAACVVFAAQHNLELRTEVNNHNTELWTAIEAVPGAQLIQDLAVMTRAVMTRDADGLGA